MMASKPHFLLFCDGHSPKSATEGPGSGVASSSRGHWRFILEDIEAGTRLEVSDAELMQAPERAALLAVVRGLEALAQPSRVTLVTTSRYVARGLQFGLIEWRESDYCWEHFGSVQPIRNADLWRRVDHALQYHQIACRWISGDVSEEGATASKLTAEPIAASPSAGPPKAVKVHAKPENAVPKKSTPRQRAHDANKASPAMSMKSLWNCALGHLGHRLRGFCQLESVSSQLNRLSPALRRN